ncbi:PHOTOPERIOD-INDEPENDENT EARLY FLOWERING 1-like protein [Drosera capensis]
MASKGPRSKLDHDSRARRQKAFEAPREPRHPKTHWDNVIEEMIWLSKEEEQRLRKIALSISKDMNRYSTMLAENFLGAPDPCEPTRQCTREEMLSAQQDKSRNIHGHRESLPDGGSGNAEIDDEYSIESEDEMDDEATLDEEEELEKAQCSSPVDEVGLLQRESEGPLDAILERYRKDSAAASSMNESQYSSPYSDTSYDQEPEEDDEPNNVDEDDSYKLLLVSPSHGQEVPSLTVDSGDGIERENRIADAAAAARSAQPTGNAFSTTKVRTKFPFLLKYPLREYQHIGLDWLVTMYEKRLNGILADEMGLGKAIMTIPLLAHLACEKGIWGPHLIVVPTSVMLNWETEFLKWCPAFKILTYFGSAK